jgi:ribonuclease HI
MQTNIRFKAYFDGACSPTNPGGTAAFGAYVIEGKERIWQCSEVYKPPVGREKETTNNIAEYLGVISVLDFFINSDLIHERILVLGDSNMVIEQSFGKWKIKKGLYKPFALVAKEKLQSFKNIEGKWIPREENWRADALSKAHLETGLVDI